jgi:phage I-like protein
VQSRQGNFVVDEQGFEEILRRFQHDGVDIVFDFEHATLEEGKEAPAAGWIKGFRFNGGVWADPIEWNARAKQMILNKEYRYFSPVVGVDKGDRAIFIHSVALTNTPAMLGQRPIINKGGMSMDWLKEVVKVLKMKAEATAEEVIAAVKALMGRLEIVDEICRILSLKADAGLDQVKTALEERIKKIDLSEVVKALSLKADATVSEIVATIHALKQSATSGVSIEEFKALKSKLAERDRDDLVTLALKEGKLAPTQNEWARDYALRDPEGFKLFIAKAPVVVPVGDIDSIKILKKGEMIDEAQAAINRMMGIDEAMFKKWNATAN